MNEIAEILLLSNQVLIRFIVSIFLSILLGLIIALIYRYTHKGMNYESSFLSTLVILAPIVTLVMFFIQGDLVLSLGLVGSMSIIRFRTPIKDTRDMVFLFWSIATGLGCGTLNWTIAIIAAVIISLLMLVFYIVKYGKQLHSEYILIISGRDDFDENILNKFIKSGKLNIQMRSIDKEGNNWEAVYEIRFDVAYKNVIDQMLKDIQKNNNVEKVSLLSPQLSLPM